MRILDIDPDMIKVTQQPRNHRKLLTIETRGGELLGIELSAEEIAALVGRLTEAAAP